MEAKFNFYGVEVTVECPSEDLYLRLCKDFSYFKIDRPSECVKKIKIRGFLNLNINPPFPLLVIRFSNRNVNIYEKNNVRVCDYRGDGLSIINFKLNTASIYASEINRLHERIYLFILSRVGKELDLLGLHRLHGMAVTRNEKLYLGMMPMNGGKTTLLSYLLNEGSYALLSDDSPLIDRKGKVYPFPIRIGFEKGGKKPQLFEQAKSYELERKEYGKKTLYSLNDLNLKVGGDYKEVFLFRGFRGFKSPRLKLKSKMSMIFFIFEQGVIGIGLPILIEYFWEFGFIDFFRKTKIFFSRMLGLGRFLLRAKVYKFEMGDNIDENVDYFKKYEGIN